MQSLSRVTHCFLLLALTTLACPVTWGEVSNTFTVASYNVENWVLMERKSQTNQPKPETERAAVIEVLASVKPDVLGVIEIGSKKELAELSDGLRKRGL